MSEIRRSLPREASVGRRPIYQDRHRPSPSSLVCLLPSQGNFTLALADASSTSAKQQFKFNTTPLLNNSTIEDHLLTRPSPLNVNRSPLRR